MTEKYQCVTLTLSDGRSISFMGPAAFTEADLLRGVKVQEITFSDPRHLPDGMYFGTVEDMEPTP
jgi:hypothetical protein